MVLLWLMYYFHTFDGCKTYKIILMVKTKKNHILKSINFNYIFKKSISLFFILLTLLIIIVYIFPEDHVLPVEGSSHFDWNSASFWDKRGSIIHKGIDIFVKEKGIFALSSTNGVVIFNGYLSLGGNVIFILGPKWKIYYYAHLEKSFVGFGDIINISQKIGIVGKTGNALNTPPHLHFEIMTMMPLIWRWDRSPEGWKKIFYLDPDKILLSK